ncbi:hypothetical protein NHX12_016571, partial [Muraenolepis orangiensis]
MSPLLTTRCGLLNQQQLDLQRERLQAVGYPETEDSTEGFIFSENWEEVVEAEQRVPRRVPLPLAHPHPWWVKLQLIGRQHRVAPPGTKDPDGERATPRPHDQMFLQVPPQHLRTLPWLNVSIVNHQKFSDVQMLLGLKKSELVQLSKTRWACQ